MQGSKHDHTIIVLLLCRLVIFLPSHKQEMKGKATTGPDGLTRGQLDKAVGELQRSIKDTDREVGCFLDYV